jgi:hypothetical protein
MSQNTLHFKFLIKYPYRILKNFLPPKLSISFVIIIKQNYFEIGKFAG